MTEQTSRVVLPSATGFAARQAVAILRKRKVPTASLLERAGVSEGDLDGRGQRISALAQGRLLEYAAEALGDNMFGLHLAEQANPREAGLLLYVASAAENIGDALALAARYCRIANEAIRLKLIRSPKEMVVEIRFVDLPRHSPGRTPNLRSPRSSRLCGRWRAAISARRKWRSPWRATRRSTSSNASSAARSSSAPQRIGSACRRRRLLARLTTQDQHLLETLQPVCEEAASERNTAQGSLQSLVENEAQKLLPHGRANRQRVAKALGLSERGLSQQLAQEGTSYDDVVDRLRRSLALQYIREPSISLAQIAWLLGYEGPGSFNHAFARWTGKSASETRNERAHGGRAARPSGWAP